jgi:soluble lytic murein transglycosylase
MHRPRGVRRGALPITSPTSTRAVACLRDDLDELLTCFRYKFAEPCLVYAIVCQESAFTPRVVCSANAIGLMQVTPAAGRDTAKRFNVTFDQRRLASDVVYNAQLGTAELGNDIASWRGSYILAFVAHNAGPRRAKEWIEQYGDPRDPKVDPIDWIERIPISETRNYVQRVIENMQVYRALIENNPKLLIEADLRRGG